MSELSRLVARHCVADFTRTAIPQLILSRSGITTEQTASMKYPLLCLITAGRKRLYFQGKTHDYDADKYLVVGTNMPMVAEVIEAPCPALSLSLDIDEMTSLIADTPPANADDGPQSLVAVSSLDHDLRDALLRLLRLLDRPERIQVLAPLIRKEILFLLLQPGGVLRSLASPGSRTAHVARAISAIRGHYAQPLRIAELAAIAKMSVPTFHRHFRSFTGFSPLQFQKQIRLQEGRRMLSAGEMDAASIALQVGYQSPSQFGREYRRMFGSPPALYAAQSRRSVEDRR